jgi:hypothetical protein
MLARKFRAERPVESRSGSHGGRAAGVGTLAIAYHFSGAILAPTAAAADRQLHLHVAQAARALLDGASNLAIGDAVANADVHGGF